jgi:chemotaxis response regulator CheB
MPFLVAIGASGSQGLTQIKDLLSLLPRQIEAVVLVVLHRPVSCVSYLREILSRVASMPVVIAQTGDRYATGTCYVGEPSGHLTLAGNGEIHLINGAHGEHRNRTVDLLFASVAYHAKERAIGVVLAGSLDDGSCGLAAIGRAGGTTMVVASEPARVRGMPENARRRAGTVDFLGTTAQIAQEILERTRRSHASRAIPQGPLAQWTSPQFVSVRTCGNSGQTPSEERRLSDQNARRDFKGPELCIKESGFPL